MLNDHYDSNDQTNSETTETSEHSVNNCAHTPLEPIAVIGMGCRFPGGANSPEEFWQLLINEKNVSSLIPEERWPLDDFYDPDPESVGKCYTRTGHFITNPSPKEFDAEFFRITPREAQILDPQQRILLEVVWEALENAAIAPTSLYGSNTGIFMGCYDNHYLSDYDLRSAEDVQYYLATSMAQSITVGRVSYFLNLHGPNLAIDTACSSSLVALHHACQSLRADECSLALTGGVNVMVSPSVFIALAKGQMLSPDGLCKTFDNAADGYGRGEGCGVIVLKRLQDALRDGDNILALILGSAINHDGRTVGITAPSLQAQKDVIQSALYKSGVTPVEVDYVEAHGTGTAVGDPVELDALAETFSKRDKNNPLMIGSVKTNIGHLEAAAGIAGIIKTILALNHEYLPVHLNVTELNKKIQWDSVSLKVVTQGKRWSIAANRRIAGVSSFGFGGSNAHVILEGAERVDVKPTQSHIDRPLHILTLSARNEESLQELSQRFSVYLLNHTEKNLSDIAYTANTGRTHFRSRLSIVGETTSEVAAALGGFGQGETSQAIIRNNTPDFDGQHVGFIFTGQGAQYPGMGQGLYEYLPSFREMLETCDRILKPHIGHSLIEILYKTNAPRKAHPINQTALTQPALFALEASLAQMLIRWGIKPAVVMGHSLGESAAAYISGVFNLDSGISMVAQRGALMQALPHNGIMVAVETDASTVRALIKAYSYDNIVGIAAYNGPHSIVISGVQHAVEHMTQLLKKQDIRTVPLRVSHAFHSELMSAMVVPFKTFISNLDLSTPNTPLVSTVTGQLVTDEITFPEHWGKGVRQPVRFEQAINTMLNMGIKTFVEIGPHPVLSGMGRNCTPDNTDLLWLPLLRKGRDDWATLLPTLGHLYNQGIEIDWHAFDSDFRPFRNKVQLPTYAFQRQKHWMNALPPKYQDQNYLTSHTKQVGHPLLGNQLQLPGKNTSYYEAKIAPNKPSWVKGHKFFDQNILPAAAYLEMALALASRHLNTQKIELSNIALHNLLHIADKGVIVHCVLHEKTNSQTSFEIYSRPVEIGYDQTIHWNLHASGLFCEFSDIIDDASSRDRIIKMNDSMPYKSTSGHHYKSFHLQGLIYGEDFQTVKEAKYNDREAIAQITLSLDNKEIESYHVHPTMLDGGLQLAGIILPIPPVRHNNVPVHIDKLRFYGQQCSSLWCLCGTRDLDSDVDSHYSVDLAYLDANGSPVVIAEGVEFQTMREEIFRQTPPKWRDWIYKIGWRRQEASVIIDKSKHDELWLIFSDTNDVGRQLAQQLLASNKKCILVGKGNHFSQINGMTYQVNPWDQGDIQRLYDAIQLKQKKNHALKGIIYLWSLDLDNASKNVDILPEILDNSVGPALTILQSLLNNPSSEPIKLTFVTRGVHAIDDDDSMLGFKQAPLWGFGRVINLEHPEYKCLMIDLDPATPHNEIQFMLEDIQRDNGNSEIAYRQGHRYIPKLVDVNEPEYTVLKSGELTFPRSSSYQLSVAQAGSFDSLYLAPLTRRLPGPEEIEIAVRATGLNFIDVLDVMGLLPFDRPTLGGECAGVVTAVGKAVSGFKIGDSVVALAPGSFSRYAITSEQLAAIIPDNLSFNQAAGIPIVYLTAYFSLYQLANLNSKDRVLIHAAAGGVGCAAIQLARHAGATIFATAHPSKWNFLRELGITHIMNSRTLEFSHDIMQATDGQGVDIILNSLSGDFIPASFNALTTNGRFVEIGKRAIWSQSKVNEFRPDIKYAVYDLITHMVNTPAVVGDTLRMLIEWIANGELLPPPITTFPLQAVKEAFRFMQEAKHTGKIVISQTEFKQKPQSKRRQQKLDGAYLVTGGWGALGIEVISWLVFRGAKQIFVVSRSNPDAETAEIINNIRDAGTQIVYLNADVSDYNLLSTVLNPVKNSQVPLRGVFHLAGILQDSVIRTLTKEQLEQVMRVKVQGAWNLHLLTLEQELDFFVMFSSVASVFGSLGQSNYSAANAFLDSLAHYRKTLGKVGLSINWGAWSGGGMATRTGTEDALVNQGVQPIPLLEGMEVFQDLVLGDYHQTIVFPVKWQQASQSPVGFPPLFSEFINGKSTNNKWRKILDEILDTPISMRRSKLGAFVRVIVAHVLRLPSADHIDDRDSFVDLGIDSLMVVELRNMLQNSLDCTLPTTLFVNYPTLEALISYLADRINIANNIVEVQEYTETQELSSDNYETLSEDELTKQLDEKLNLLEQYTHD